VTPFLVFAEPAVSFGLASDVITSPRSAAATTGLVSSSGLTVSLAAADGLRRDGARQGSAEVALSPQLFTHVLQTLFKVRDVLVEAFRMLHDQPVPFVAPTDPARLLELDSRLPDEQQAIPLSAQAAAPPAVDDGSLTTVPVVAAAECKAGLGTTIPAEPVIARAETHPWWLASYENTPKEPAAAAEPLPEPTTADRAAALVTALWLGGLALRVSAPDPPTEEESHVKPRDRTKGDDGTKE